MNVHMRAAARRVAEGQGMEEEKRGEGVNGAKAGDSWHRQRSHHSCICDAL
jgi:hypothetical protein